MRVTIDASVWVNGDSPDEKGFAESRQFLDQVRLAALQIFVPSILLIEVSSAVARMKRDSERALRFLWR